MAGGKNIWENVIVFVLIGIIICFVTPIIQGIFYKSQTSGAKTNAENLVKTAKELYADLNLEREVTLPFTVSFNENKTYDLYENTTKIADNQLLTRGQRPTSGNIIIDKRGNVTVINLRFNDIFCNMEKGQPMICTRKQAGK